MDLLARQRVPHVIDCLMDKVVLGTATPDEVRALARYMVRGELPAEATPDHDTATLDRET